MRTQATGSSHYSKMGESSSRSVVKVDIQRELRLTGFAIEDNRRKAAARETHIANLLAKLQASHEHKKKKNIGLSKQTSKPNVKTSVFSFPGASSSPDLRSQSSRDVNYNPVYTTRTVLRTEEHTLLLPPKPKSARFFHVSSTYNNSARARKQGAKLDRTSPSPFKSKTQFGESSRLDEKAQNKRGGASQPSHTVGGGGASQKQRSISSARRARHFFGGAVHKTSTTGQKAQEKRERPKSAK